MVAASPDDWKAVTPGMGSCFHQALHRWALLRQQGEIYKVAIGVVMANERDPQRHLHAWLATGYSKTVISAVSGECVLRATFYEFVGIERPTVRLVNPRSIMRARDGIIDRETIEALLNASGIRWMTGPGGGVIPRD